MLICTYKEQVCIKKDHEKFKILDILAVTTQAHEGIETGMEAIMTAIPV